MSKGTTCDDHNEPARFPPEKTGSLFFSFELPAGHGHLPWSRLMRAGLFLIGIAAQSNPLQDAGQRKVDVM